MNLASMSQCESLSVVCYEVYKSKRRTKTAGGRGKKRELSWIFLLNKAKRFVNLAKSDFLPAAIHLSAILTPKLLISLIFSPSVTVLDSFLMSGYSNIPFFFLHLSIDSLTHAACWQTDLHMWDMRYPVNEYGWSRPSVHLPLAFTDTECWQGSESSWTES